MSDEIIGYRKTGKDQWTPIIHRYGGVATAAILFCSECRITISSSGGPGHNCLCPSCYEEKRVVDFINGSKNV